MSLCLRAAAALLMLSPSLARSAPPVFEALYPAGGQVGSSFTITASGKMEADARLWIDCPDVVFVPAAEKRQWQATILPGAQPGLHLVRAYNREGASAPRWFSIGTLPEIAEVEPNNEVGKAQPVARLPATANARLDPAGDVDNYSVRLEAGQTLVALVEAYALGSPVDMLAHVLDPQGIRVLTASDGRNLDPIIVYKAPAAGLYTVQVAGFVHPPAADVRFTGGATVVYRLHLSAAPTVSGVFPPVVSSAKATPLEPRMFGSAAASQQPWSAPAMAGRADGDIVTLNVPGALEPLQAVVMAQAAVTEKEPNNEFGKANVVAAGAPVAGRLDAGDPEDHFAIEAKKGDRLRARVFAQALGSPLDAVLTVSDAQGNQVYESDDANDGSDPNGVWKVASDGRYDVRVRDRFGKSGAEYAYVLCIKAVMPDFEVTLPDGKPVTVKAGKSAQIKLKVDLRDGFGETLQCRLANLPLGLFAKETAIPAKGGEFQLTLEASPDAPPFQGPVWISVWPQKANTFKTASYDLRGDTKRGTSLLDSAEALWLTVQ